ncbi:MAG: hypothetical protein DI603_10490 [Roseateles depolymerans]|uniref:Sulfatase N-terminal domain-containing protein n=1 Tax=Roseateles depolymerans TaxID=76731 RepID=A0A2W5DNZ5_9BURK|nr:MAG: hypothetical protein DI603_10490 [Roseateles depolymerans]
MLSASLQSWTAPRVRPQAGLAGLVVFLLWTVVGATWFLRTYLGLVTPDQLLFHLQHGGLDYADPRMLSRAARCLAAVLALTALTLFLLRGRRRGLRLLMWALLGGGAVVSVNATVIDPCLPDPSGADYLARYYVDPGEVTLQAPARKPDILMVYIESLDEDYTHPRQVRQPLLPQLSVLQEEFQTLGDLHNLSGASWTVGGMFSSLCGLPLKPVGLMSHNAMEYSQRFFPQGRCLTDLLAEQGWDISFYGGASLKFAGKGQFLADHGVTRQFGAEQWKARGVPVPPQGWGLLDSALTEQAWQDMRRPRDGDRPRMSMLLTVDTHGPMGARDPGCGAALDQDEDDLEPAVIMRGALRCSDRVVARLVERFVAQADGRPKVVWVMGDHITPMPLLTGELQGDAARGRTVFHALARYDAEGRPLPAPDLQRQFTHVDVLPTLAEAIGLSWSPQPHRLGLGVSLLAQPAQPTLMERVGLRTLDGRLSCRSPLYQRLWLPT